MGALSRRPLAIVSQILATQHRVRPRDDRKTTTVAGRRQPGSRRVPPIGGPAAGRGRVAAGTTASGRDAFAAGDPSPAQCTLRYAAGIRPWLDGSVLFLLYFLTGAIGLRFLQHIDSRHLSLLPAVAVPWVASGVAVAGLLLRGNRLAPAVFFASVALWRGLAHDPWMNVLADALGETLATLLVAELLRRYGFLAQFDRSRDLALLIGAAAVGLIVPAIFDALSLHVAGAVAPQTLTPELLDGLAPSARRILGMTRFELMGYLRWWINSVAGVTLVVPALLPMSASVGQALRRRWREAGVFVVALGTAAVAIGGGPPATWRLSLVGLGVVLVAWAAVRFGVALASTTTLALSLAAAVGYGLGLGPVAAASPGEGSEVLWGFIGLLGATGLFLTTVVVEHESTMCGLENLKARHEALFEAIPRPLYALSESGGWAYHDDEHAGTRHKRLRARGVPGPGPGNPMRRCGARRLRHGFPCRRRSNGSVTRPPHSQRGILRRRAVADAGRPWRGRRAAVLRNRRDGAQRATQARARDRRPRATPARIGSAR